jgi:hypothetical protein
VAANPHGGGAAEQAKRILDLLAKAPPGGAIKMDVVPAETGSSGAAETGE